MTGHGTATVELACPNCGWTSYSREKIREHMLSWCEATPDTVKIGDLEDVEIPAASEAGSEIEPVGDWGDDGPPETDLHADPPDALEGTDDVEQLDQDDEDDVDEDLEDDDVEICPVCEDPFTSRQGLKIHYGQKHRPHMPPLEDVEDGIREVPTASGSNGHAETERGPPSAPEPQSSPRDEADSGSKPHPVAHDSAGADRLTVDEVQLLKDLCWWAGVQDDELPRAERCLYAKIWLKLDTLEQEVGT